MKRLAGALLIAVAFLVSVYVGGWLLLAGGIRNIFNGIQATPNNGGQIVWGVIEVFVLTPALQYLALRLALVYGFCLVLDKQWSERPRWRRRSSSQRTID